MHNFDEDDIESWTTRDREKVRKTLPAHHHAIDGKMLLEAAEEFQLTMQSYIVDFQNDPRIWGRVLVLKLVEAMTLIAEKYGFDPMHLKVAWEMATREGYFHPDHDDIPMAHRDPAADLGQFFRISLDHVRVMSAEASAFAWEKMREANDPYWRADRDEEDM